MQVIRHSIKILFRVGARKRELKAYQKYPVSAKMENLVETTFRENYPFEENIKVCTEKSSLLLTGSARYFHFIL